MGSLSPEVVSVAVLDTLPFLWDPCVSSAQGALLSSVLVPQQCVKCMKLAAVSGIASFPPGLA